MSPSRRLVVASVATVLLACVGCTTSVGGMAAPGTDPGGSSQDPGPASSPPDPVEPENAFDECGLFPPEELAELLGIDETLYITEREAVPNGNTGRVAVCGYFNENVPGVVGMWIDTAVDTDEERFFAPFEEYKVIERGFGDRAEFVPRSVSSTGLQILELRVLQGDVGIHIRYDHYEESSSGMPELPAKQVSGAMVRIAGKSFEELPDEVVLAPGTPEGRCADIDPARAAGVLGGELTTVRSVLSDGGGMNCSFRGDDTALSVVVLTDPEQARDARLEADELNVTDLGDGARMYIADADDGEQGSLNVRIHAGDHVVKIFGLYGPDAGTFTEPRPEDKDLARAILEAVTG